MTIVSPKRNLRKAMPAFFPVTIKIAHITTLSPVHPFLIRELRAYIFWQIDKIVSSKVDMVHVCTKSLGREKPERDYADLLYKTYMSDFDDRKKAIKLIIMEPK